MHISLSNRLKACCSLIHPEDRVADVGCDHGYLGIYLLLLLITIGYSLLVQLISFVTTLYSEFRLR